MQATAIAGAQTGSGVSPSSLKSRPMISEFSLNEIFLGLNSVQMPCLGKITTARQVNNVARFSLDMMVETLQQ